MSEQEVGEWVLRTLFQTELDRGKQLSMEALLSLAEGCLVLDSR
jgi:hypothetical protein